MHLKSVDICRPNSYDGKVNPLQGSIVFSDSVSEHTIALSPLEINLIIEAISATIANRAKQQVKLIPDAAITAVEENKLIVGEGRLLTVGNDEIPF